MELDGTQIVFKQFSITLRTEILASRNFATLIFANRHL